jgi:hypothetical protein
VLAIGRNSLAVSSGPEWRCADDAQATDPGPPCYARLTIQEEQRQECGRQRTPIRQWIGKKKEKTEVRLLGGRFGKGRASLIEESRSEVTPMLPQGPTQSGRINPMARVGVRRAMN